MPPSAWSSADAGGRSPIAGSNRSAGQIDARCGLSQSTVSAHLATLQRAGFVTSTRIGQWAFFRRNEAVIDAFHDALRREL